MPNIRFAKMAGAGNDFILIDVRQTPAPEPIRDFVARVCQRRVAVGADGLLLLGAPRDGRYVMRYFNADGSEAGMCGNGIRCLARFVVLIGAAREGEEVAFTNAAGVYRAVVTGSSVRLGMPPPSGLETNLVLKLKGGERSGDFIHTGVPHVVFFTERLDTEPVTALGREVRNHTRFAPAGTNVNFCQVVDEHRVRVRTYERGVEDETLACGTGSTAAGLLAACRGWVKSPVAVVTRSGEVLDLEFTFQGEGFTEVYQSGSARLVYWGELSDEATRFHPLPA
jgi:diaminopimelate epimerase